MQAEQTIIHTSLKYTPEQHTCPHCLNPIEQKTNDTMIQVLFVQVARMSEKHEAEIYELKKMMQETELSLQESNESLRYLKAQKVK